MNLLDLARAAIQQEVPATPIRVALRDPADALTCYRALAVEHCGTTGAATVDHTMQTCRQCINLSARGNCLAAPRGESFGPGIVMVRDYAPKPDRPLRCLPYRPRPNDADQRTGAERWPFLSSTYRG